MLGYLNSVNIWHVWYVSDIRLATLTEMSVQQSLRLSQAYLKAKSFKWIFFSIKIIFILFFKYQWAWWVNRRAP